MDASYLDRVGLPRKENDLVHVLSLGGFDEQFARGWIPDALGREAMPMTTRDQVRSMLDAGPTSADVIAARLALSPRQVQSQLGQLRRRGEARLVKRGIQGVGGYPGTWARTARAARRVRFGWLGGPTMAGAGGDAAEAKGGTKEIL